MASYAFNPSSLSACCDGVKLIVPQGATLPTNLCIRCGAPANGKPLKKTFYWHSPYLYFTVFCGLMIYLILALIVRKQITLYVPICDEHSARRIRMILLGWALVLAGIASIFLAAWAHLDVWLSIFIVLALILAGGIVGAAGANVISAKYIDARYASFTGACRAFLDQLPPAMNAAAVPPGSFPPPPPIG
ncbi:MAG TPA: hypothetical protein VJ723_08320 [Candidatus Angelobacter sp.]|nr:hypothetical protein [Candidatus Angelobacter sp.]